MPPSLQIVFADNLVVGPAQSGEGGVPAGATTIPYQTNPSPKCVAVSTGDQVANVSSPSSFVTLSMGGVTQGTFLFLRVTGTMTIRRTTNGTGSPAVDTISGLLVVESDPGSYMTLLEAQGTGVVEYLVAGPQ